MTNCYNNHSSALQSCGEKNDNGVYLDSDHFNDINWGIFHEDSIAYQTNFEYPFHESPGTGLRFFADNFPNVNSFSKCVSEVVVHGRV